MDRSAEPRFSGADMDPNQPPRHTPSPASGSHHGSHHGYGAPFQAPRTGRHPYPPQWHHAQPGAYSQPHAGQGGNNFRGPAFFEEESDMRAIPDNQRYVPNRYTHNPFQEASHMGGPHNNGFHRGLPHPGYYNQRSFGNMPRNPNAPNSYGGPQMGYHPAPHDLGYHQNGQDAPPPYDDEQPQAYDGADDVESEGNYRGSDPEWNEGEGHQSDGAESEFVASGENAEDDDEMDFEDEEKPSKKVYDYDLSPKHNTKYSGLIKNHADYLNEKDRRRRDETANKTGAEWNIPTKPEEMRKHVESLFNAIKNLKGIYDQPTAGGHPAQAVARIRNGYYPDDYLELVCWEILMSCIDSSKEHHLVRSFHKTKYEDNEAIGGFVGRIERVRSALEKSKAVCKQVLDPLYLHRLCDAPAAELQMKEANRKLNSVRDRQNKIGREVIKSGTVNMDSLKDLKDLRLKTPASNKRRPSAPRSKSAKKPEKTLVTPLKSPAKRKLGSGRSTTKVKYESEDSDEDAFSDDFNTPSKRRGTGNRGSAVARGKTTTTPRKSANGVTPSKRPPRAAAVAADVNRRKALNELDESERSELSQTPAPILTKEEIAVKAQEQRAMGSVDDSLEDKETRYKLMICDILRVNVTYADQLNLQELRTYARAFNVAFGQEVWEVPNSNGARAVGPNIFAPGQDAVSVHIAKALPRFQELALARGDLTDNLEVNADAQNQFASYGEVEIDRALGVLENEFGRFAAPEDHE